MTRSVIPSEVEGSPANVGSNKLRDSSPDLIGIRMTK